MSFKEAVKNVMKGGKYDKKSAAAIVANASRNASPAAKRKNPKLKNLKLKNLKLKNLLKKKPQKKSLLITVSTPAWLTDCL